MKWTKKSDSGLREISPVPGTKFRIRNTVDSNTETSVVALPLLHEDPDTTHLTENTELEKVCLWASVSDPDPVGSEIICRIRIRYRIRIQIRNEILDDKQNFGLTTMLIYVENWTI